MKYTRFIYLFAFLLFSSNAFSLSCGIDWNPKVAFEQAEHFFVVKIISVSLNEELIKKMPGSSDDTQNEMVINSIQYEVVENLKGEGYDYPKLITSINLGLGGANLLPGAYYLLSITAKGQKIENDLYHYVTYCDVHESSISIESKKFAEALETIRDYEKD